MSGTVLGALALGTAWIGGWPFAVLWLAAALAVAAEWLLMVRAEPFRPLAGTAFLGIAAAILACRTTTSAYTPWAIVLLTGLVMAMLASDPRSRAWALAGLATAAVVGLVPVLVRTGGGASAATAIVWIFAVVWTSDVAAFFTGRAFGGRKLWPAVSPKKTWSGAAGGLVGATLAGTAVGAIDPRFGSLFPGGLSGLATASAIGSVASQAGDLAESAMKRAFQVKDSGRLIPGHGGVMDRLDGFAAVALLCGLVLAGARFAAP